MRLKMAIRLQMLDGVMHHTRRPLLGVQQLCRSNVKVMVTKVVGVILKVSGVTSKTLGAVTKVVVGTTAAIMEAVFKPFD